MSRSKQIKSILKVAKRKARKNIKNFGDPNKSERQKFIDTLMADVGLTSLNELSREERVRFLAAAKPQPVVERSLRKRKSRKASAVPSFFRQNLDYGERRASSRRDALGGLLKTATEEPAARIDLGSMTLDDARGTLQSVIGSGLAMSNGHGMSGDALEKEQVWAMQLIMEDSFNCILNVHSIDGAFGGETEAAVSLFQKSNKDIGLQETGSADTETLTAMLSPESKMCVSEETDEDFVPEPEDSGAAIAESGANMPSTWADVTDDQVFSRIDMREGSRGRAGWSDGSKPEVQDYLRIMAYVMIRSFPEEKVTISSGYRSPEGQARVMASNWNQNGGSEELEEPVAIRGTDDRMLKTKGTKYLVDLYANNDMAYTAGTLLEEGRGEEAKEFLRDYYQRRVDSRPPGSTGHGSGRSLDMVSSDYGTLEEILNATKRYASIKIGDETSRNCGSGGLCVAGRHFHVDIKRVRRGVLERIQRRMQVT